MVGGEIYVKKIPSMNIIDIATSVAPLAALKVVGIRPGEKLHEQMIGLEDAPFTYEYAEHFKILPMINGWSEDPARIKNGVRVVDDFVYVWDSNGDWMSRKALQAWILNNAAKIEAI